MDLSAKPTVRRMVEEFVREAARGEFAKEIIESALEGLRIGQPGEDAEVARLRGPIEAVVYRCCQEMYVDIAKIIAEALDEPTAEAIFAFQATPAFLAQAKILTRIGDIRKAYSPYIMGKVMDAVLAEHKEWEGEES